uniref:Uncharacterized protein n=1 Tax=Solanum lycopersicum TaxID=4081 RepID=A0A3Q7FH04_SOLLC
MLVSNIYTTQKKKDLYIKKVSNPCQKIKSFTSNTDSCVNNLGSKRRVDFVGLTKSSSAAPTH